MVAHKEKMPPIHPGEILKEEFLEPMGISEYRLAKSINVPQTRISGIVKGKRSITPDTALRLAHFFAMSPEFWLGIQMQYDLERIEDELGGRLEEEVTPASELKG